MDEEDWNENNDRNYEVLFIKSCCVNDLIKFKMLCYDVLELYDKYLIHNNLKPHIYNYDDYETYEIKYIDGKRYNNNNLYGYFVIKNLIKEIYYLLDEDYNNNLLLRLKDYINLEDYKINDYIDDIIIKEYFIPSINNLNKLIFFISPKSFL